MEIMDGTKVPEPQKKQSKDPTFYGNIYLGVILILIGVVWLFYNFGMILPHHFDILFSWRMLLIVVGGYLITVRRYTAGVVVGGFGLLFLIMQVANLYISFSKIILPAVVIAVGVGLLISHLNKKS